ncbi:zeta toxin family protein [Chitinophaga sp. S165]|uniref:zeta toxin family protein n=1 Tax=Chitinophaga sp. S165 TaxID=2135462 RepID=UPI000D70F656|nr:zeta toxin family protein [Chitinophaga sp. S165]PWV49081.1 putative ABC-type ATPase [Chitinophaga sp. S165]
MSAPRLFIIAGPNGSGKSLFSKVLTGKKLNVFDGDKHMSSLVKQFPETGSEALWSYIDSNIFMAEKLDAIHHGSDYAFETNFSSSDRMSSARQFKEKGYEVHLIFMGLNSIEESIQRVEQRVQLGGHKVAEPSIRYNYEHGYKNLYKYFREFDSVSLYDNSIPNIAAPQVPEEILYITGGELHLNMKKYPDWVSPLMKAINGSSI